MALSQHHLGTDFSIGGYEHMDAFPLLGEITAAECAKWLTETLAPERLALSVVAPKGGEDDADDDA